MTTDAAYHAWHQVFDKTLRDLETKELAPALETLLAGMRKNAPPSARPSRARRSRRTPRASSTSWRSLGRARSAATRSSSARAPEAEKALIDAHAESTESPILGSVTDYSLFTPRGHYTRSEALTRYFVAMSVLGQTAFRLPGSVQTDETVVAGCR